MMHTLQVVLIVAATLFCDAAVEGFLWSEKRAQKRMRDMAGLPQWVRNTTNCVCLVIGLVMLVVAVSIGE